ncbi:type II secretion system F family protein [Actinokineospora sp.]|uniref:type II secretion system F family protein n=1 Tax=Actinokineospora sp. TaxID=1872133 RepID=UPI0040381FED
MTAALVLLAMAMLLWSPHRPDRSRLARLTGAATVRPRRRPPLPLVAGLSAGTLAGVLVGPVAGLVAALAAWWAVTRSLRPRPSSGDDLALAATWDLLAACLRAGLPVPAAIRAVATDLPERPAIALRDTADLLALGGDPVQAWSGALDCPETAALARGARRTARSGAALAGVARSLAAAVRERAEDAAEARAQRAAVLISGPLGLCFLPAFVCLGVLPVVIGLAGQLSIAL